MPLLADKRITVRNLRYDPDTDTETEIYTVLDGVSVHAKTVAAAADDGLHACCVVQIRIFSADTLSAPQSTPDAPLPAGDTYLEPAAWAGADAAEAAKAWTLRPGDRIEYKGQTLTLLAVHDNRGLRRCPHWYAEAH